MNWLIYITLSLTILTACNESTDDDSARDRSTMLKDFRHNTIIFKDSIDQLLPGSTVQKSLIFSKDNYSFYASRHLDNRNIFLYKEIGILGNSNFIEKRFYLKGGDLILFELYEKNDPDSALASTLRSYFRKGKLVISESDQSVEYQTEELFSSTGHESRKILEDLQKLRDAINQKGEFDLVYDNFAYYPKARYLILSNDQINPYRAAIRIEEADDFIKMILSNPEKYKGRKLNLKWHLREPFEALYLRGRLD